MLRLTGGLFRGRAIQAPPHQNTRPTQSKLRQALFNSLQAKISEARVLDLFAGSGALGFEALSRGASHVVFVESVRSVAKLIQKNADTLNVSHQVQILVEPVSSVLPLLDPLAPFDLVLADPPYGENWEDVLVQNWPWKKLLVPGGIFCVEWGIQKKSQTHVAKETLPEGPFLEKVREKKYGDSMLTSYSLSGN